MTSKVPASLRVIGRSIVDWWDGWLDMVVMIIVWILAQVTIVLGPPATFGVYYVVHNMINGQALGFRGLIEGGRKYFVKAWIWGLINIFVIITIVVNYIFYGGFEATWALYVQILVLMVGFLWLCTQFYALPYFMEQEYKSLKVAMRNGVLTTLAAPFFTFILMVLAGIIGVLSFVIIIPMFLGLPALIPFLGFRGMLNRLEAFGLREREKTPKEIEYEESSKIRVPGIDRDASSEATGDEVADEEGQVKQEK